MITLKSRREIELMRKAGQLVAQAHQLVFSMLKPGILTKEIDQAVEELFNRHKATPLFKGVPGKVPFPAVTCISVNDQIVHGVPGDYELQEGDIVSVDTGCRLNGWCGDAAWTYQIGQVDPLKERLLHVGQKVLQVAIDEMGRQDTWSRVAVRMEEEVKKEKFSVVEEFVGHGIGQEMHEDPQVPNFISPQMKQHDFRLEPGLVLAVEPMVNAGSKHVRVLGDHWTVATKDGQPSVHFEHTIAITEEGTDILTQGVGSPPSS